MMIKEDNVGLHPCRDELKTGFYNWLAFNSFLNFEYHEKETHMKKMYAIACE